MKCVTRQKKYYKRVGKQKSLESLTQHYLKKNKKKKLEIELVKIRKVIVNVVGEPLSLLIYFLSSIMCLSIQNTSI